MVARNANNGISITRTGLRFSPRTTLRSGHAVLLARSRVYARTASLSCGSTQHLLSWTRRIAYGFCSAARFARRATTYLFNSSVRFLVFLLRSAVWFSASNITWQHMPRCAARIADFKTRVTRSRVLSRGSGCAGTRSSLHWILSHACAHLIKRAAAVCVLRLVMFAYA